jgi:hypothetical protein
MNKKKRRCPTKSTIVLLEIMAKTIATKGIKLKRLKSFTTT